MFFLIIFKSNILTQYVGAYPCSDHYCSDSVVSLLKRPLDSRTHSPVILRNWSNTFALKRIFLDHFSKFGNFQTRPSLRCTELVDRKCTDEGWEIWNALHGKYERPRLRNMKWVKCNLRSTGNKHPTFTNFHSTTVTQSLILMQKQECHTFLDQYVTYFCWS